MFTIVDNQFNVYESEVLRTPQYLLTCAYFSYFGFKKKQAYDAMKWTISRWLYAK